jgi:hypothetical protein
LLPHGISQLCSHNILLSIFPLSPNTAALGRVFYVEIISLLAVFSIEIDEAIFSDLFLNRLHPIHIIEEVVNGI